jgi:hypothetical protein
MSNIAMQGGATGTGTVTLLAPVTNTNRTLTLPDVTGTVALQGGTGVGKVLQVVQATIAASTSTASTSFVTTGLTVSITPTSATSKILILSNITSAYVNGNGAQFTVYRNASNIAPSGSGIQQNLMQLYSAALTQGNVSNSILDAPATTSSTTYTVYFAASGGTVYFNANGQTSFIQVMEIAA